MYDETMYDFKPTDTIEPTPQPTIEDNTQYQEPINLLDTEVVEDVEGEAPLQYAPELQQKLDAYKEKEARKKPTTVGQIRIEGTPKLEDKDFNPNMIEAFLSEFDRGVVGMGAYIEDSIVEGVIAVDEIKARALDTLMSAVTDRQPILADKSWEDTKNAREEAYKKYHKTIQVSNYINDGLDAIGVASGVKLMSMDDILISTTEVKRVIDKEETSNWVKGAAIMGEMSAFIATWEASLGKTKTFQKIATKPITGHSVGDIAKTGAGAGAQEWAIRRGQGESKEDAARDALIATAFSTGIMSVLSGGKAMHKNWNLPFSKEGAKVIDGFMEEALTHGYKGKKANLIADAKDFGRLTVYGSWEATPNILKAIFLSSKSDTGRSKIANAMAQDDQVYDAMMGSLQALDEGAKQMVGDVVNLAKPIKLDITRDNGRTNFNSTTLVQDILTRSGLIKSVGDTKDITGVEWQIPEMLLTEGVPTKKIDEALNGLKAGNKADVETLKHGLAGVNDSVPPTTVGIAYREAMDNILHRVASYRAGFDSVDDAIRSGQSALQEGVDRSESLAGVEDLVLEQLKRAGIPKPKMVNNKIVSIDVAPIDIYNAYTGIRRELAKEAVKEKYDAKATAHIADALLDILDEMTGNSGFKDVIKNAVASQRAREKILQQMSLDQLGSSVKNLSANDILTKLSQTAKTVTSKQGETQYKYLLESLAKEDQIPFETGLIKTLVLQKAKDTTAFTSGNQMNREALSSLNASGEFLRSFKPLTREGRILLESLNSIQGTTKHLLKKIASAEFERSPTSTIWVGVTRAFWRTIGKVQTNRGAISNTPYLAKKLKNLDESFKFEEAPLSGNLVLKEYKRKLRDGSFKPTTDTEDALKFSQEIARKINNLSMLKEVEKVNEGSWSSAPIKPTPPNTLTPPTSGVAPPPTSGVATPTPNKAPETTIPQPIVDSIVDHGMVVDSVKLTPEQVEQFKTIQQSVQGNIGKTDNPTDYTTDNYKAFGEEVEKAKGREVILIDPTGNAVHLNAEKPSLDTIFHPIVIREKAINSDDTEIGGMIPNVNTRRKLWDILKEVNPTPQQKQQAVDIFKKNNYEIYSFEQAKEYMARAEYKVFDERLSDAQSAFVRAEMAKRDIVTDRAKAEFLMQHGDSLKYAMKIGGIK